LHKAKADNRGWLSWLVGVSAALAAAVWVLTTPLPRVVGLSARYDLTLVVPAALILLTLAFRLRGGWGQSAALGLTLVLFCLPLAGLWASGASESYTVGGLLPYSDAQVYYRDALRVTEGDLLSSFSARRPLFPAFLAGALALSGRNLQAALALTALVTAVSCWLAARETARTHGSLAGAVALVGLFLFSRRFAGTTMTESLGLALGALGWGLLWRGAADGRLWTIAAGLALSALALNARAGAFFTLALWVVWLGVWGVKGWPRILGRAALGLAAVGLAFGANLLLVKTLSAPGGVAFANFADTLYGLAAGGKGWQQIEADAPQVAKMDEPQRSQEIYALALERMRTRPQDTLMGAFRAWGDFFRPDREGVFGFVDSQLNLETRLSVRVMIWGLYVLSAAGLWGLMRRRREAWAGLIAFGLAGLLLSVPFVPPVDAGRMRAYAASLPLLVTLPALGVWEVGMLLHLKVLDGWLAAEADTPRGLLWGWAGVVSAWSCVGALAVFALAQPSTAAAPQCAPGEKGFVFHHAAGSTVQVIADEAAGAAWLPRVPESLFERGSRTLAPDFYGDLAELPVPFSLVQANDLNRGGMVWLVLAGEDLPPHGLTAVCAVKINTPGLGWRNFYTVRRWEVLTPDGGGQ